MTGVGADAGAVDSVGKGFDSTDGSCCGCGLAADLFVSFNGFGCWALTIAVLFVDVGLSVEMVMEEDSITGAATGAGCATAAVAVGGGLDKRDSKEPR